MPLQDRQLDFEDFSTDTEKVSAILKRTEISSQKHKLCFEYYRARKFALLTPALLSCCSIGIIGFCLSTDEVVKDHMKAGGSIPVEDILTLVVGCLGIFVGMNLLMLNQWDYGGREGMHLSAYLQCEELGNKVRFWRMDRRMNDVNGSDSDHNGLVNEGGRAVGVVKAPNSEKMAVVVASGKALRKVEKELKEKTVKATKTESKRDEVLRFASYNGIYHQINLSCSSAIPNELSRPFDLFESRLECMSLGHLGVVWDTRMRRNQICRLAAVEIYNEISAYWLWPFGTPDMEKVLDRSMKRVARLISKDYREPIKVECCGFTIFRCCCRKPNPKSNALHDIWDGMEDRERDMMEVRGITNYVDSGDRYFGSSPMEDEAFAAEHKLHHLESGDYSQPSFRSQDRSYYPQPQAVGHSTNQHAASTTQRSNYGHSHHHVRRIAPESERHTTEFPLLIGGGDHSVSRQSVGYSRTRRGEEVEHSISDTRSRMSTGTGRQDGSRVFVGNSSVHREEHSISDTRSRSIRSGQHDGGSRTSVGNSQVRGGGGQDHVRKLSQSNPGWDEASESQYMF